MSPHVATVTQLCFKFMTYDPNYNYDGSEEEEDESMDVEDGDDEGLCCSEFRIKRKTFFQELWPGTVV